MHAISYWVDLGSTIVVSFMIGKRTLTPLVSKGIRFYWHLIAKSSLDPLPLTQTIYYHIPTFWLRFERHHVIFSLQPCDDHDVMKEKDQPVEVQHLLFEDTTVMPEHFPLGIFNITSTLFRGWAYQIDPHSDWVPRIPKGYKDKLAHWCIEATSKRL